MFAARRSSNAFRTAIFQTTYDQIVDTFWVGEGTWHFVQYYPYRYCDGFPWYQCHDYRVFQKFELLNGSAVAHFGARVY